MSTAPSRVYAARLVGLPIFDPQGDQVGKVRDVVVAIRAEGSQPRVLGLVGEVFGRRRIFVPMTRVTNIDSGQVYTTGLLNMRRFEQRSTETLVMGELLDRKVTITTSGISGTVYDVAMEQARNRDWVLSRVAVQEPAKALRRRGQTHVVEWGEVTGLARPEPTQGATRLLHALNELRPADAASVIHDLPPERRSAVVAALTDERLADVLEELPEEDQVEILGFLADERAADVLEEMDPDDAADLIAELPPETAEALLQLMEPDEAEDVMRLMSYVENTAGAMMTSEPVILGPDATVADALAHVRNPDLTPALAALVYVCRPPLETPTGRFLGVAHIQRLLREPPSTLVAGALDESMREPALRGDDRRGGRPPGDLQPGRRAGHRRERPPARRGDRRRPARPHAPRELARPGGAQWLIASEARPAAPGSTPRARPVASWSGGRPTTPTCSASSPSSSRGSWGPRSSSST